ncbi:MAG: acetyl-CoA carboxylase biotin carboxyl carrier protein subunit, partial [Bacteroidales bacterium]|nr:acetyl-CoA carboxylase biotin carboxyl carrier protein subunit [Bacteroidales bacterium]
AAAPVQAAPAAAAAPASKPAGAGEKVASPLPGVIIEISVKEGQQVKAGQKVAILEAMKMENEIPAPKDGTITEIHVHKGDTLQEGDPVVTIA